MSSILQVVDALESTISTATGLRVHAIVPDDINPPTLFVVPPAVERGAFARGQMELTLELIVFTSRSVDRVGQRLLLEYANFTGPKSIFKAIDDRKDLGLGDTDAAVLRYRPLGIDEIAAYGYFGGSFETLILTAGA